MHKLSDASFTAKGSDDKNHTVKGALFVVTNDGFDASNVSGDTHIGQVVFVTASNDSK
jgi:hypothetical protein